MASQSPRAFNATEPSQSRRACRATACGSYGWLLPTPFWCLSPFALSTSVKPEADALHNVSSAMTSLYYQVEHRRNTHVRLRSPGRTEGIVSSWRDEHLTTTEAITLRRHDSDSLSSKTSESNTASETTEQSFTPQRRVSHGIRPVHASSLVSSRLGQLDSDRPGGARTGFTFFSLGFFFFLKKTSSSSDFCLSFHCNGSIFHDGETDVRMQQRRPDDGLRLCCRWQRR